MAEEQQEGSEDRIDIDLTGIDKPFLTVPEGNYPLVLADIKLGRSKTDRPMLTCHWETEHPETAESIAIFDYPLLDQQRGKFRLRQIIFAAGADEKNYTIGELVGATAEAEVTVEDSEEYGEQNRLNQLLVEVPKAV